MKKALTVLLILSLPALGILGHDLYVSFYKEGAIDLGQPLKLSDLGWLWVTYLPDSYDWAHGSVSLEAWTRFVDPLLRLTASVAAFVPAAAIAGIVLVVVTIREKGLFLRGGSAAAKKARKSGSGDRKQSKPVKYSRK